MSNTPPEGENPEDSAAPKPAPWAWEPQLSGEPDAAGAPPSDGGQEMLERLRERGLLDDAPAPPPPPPAFQPGPASPEVPEPAVAASAPFGASDAPAAAPESAPPPPPAPPAPPLVPPSDRYPMRFEVEYPQGLSRLSTFFRGFLILPVWLVNTLVQYFAGYGLLVGFTTVFWRKKYPGWLFDGMSGAYSYTARSQAYWLLLTDQFPSFSRDESAVLLEYDEPPSGYLSRWRVFFWKLILLIPHFVVLSMLMVALLAVTFIAWFGILFTGNYPRGLFQFSVGVQRWYWRTVGYFASFNDRFPPYALSADAGPASNGATVANGFIGAGLAAGLVTLFAVAAQQNDQITADGIDYAQLEAGRQQQAHVFQEEFGERTAVLRLQRAIDPGDTLVQIIRPAPGERIVVFQWSVVNGTRSAARISGEAARFKFGYQNEDGDDDDKSIAAAVIAVNNVTAPANVAAGHTATVQAAFVVPEDAIPLELVFHGGFFRDGIKYVFDD